MKIKIPALLLALLVLSGCTRSIATKYNEGLTLENNNLEGKAILVEKFEDQRAWIDAEDIKSQSFIAQQGPWKFGLDYDGQEFFPVNSMLQDIFVRELIALGSNASASTEEIDADYTLSGAIMNFEFENETGIVTVTSRRHIALAVTLVDKQGNAVFTNELFNELHREGEGMGVMHSTNVTKLMDGVLKKVLINVVEKINTELAYSSDEDVTILLNGQGITAEVSRLYVMQ